LILLFKTSRSKDRSLRQLLQGANFDITLRISIRDV
jgi:hypothetical protein